MELRKNVILRKREALSRRTQCARSSNPARRQIRAAAAGNKGNIAIPASGNFPG
jgi:hypothetical protein